MEKKVLRDCLGAKLVSHNIVSEFYDKIYYQANEDLIDIYLDLDFEDKDVLSVVSSSDQVYTPKLLGARHVDGFDKNRITKYYYYMRKWAIKYNNQIYPYELIDGDNNYLKRLLNVVEVSSKSEKDAYNFWNYICNNDIDIDSLFYEDNVNVGSTLFDNNIKYIKDVSKEDIRFYNINLFDNINTNKKYDYIMMSNIIEYALGDIDKLKIVRDNLYKLLKDDGKIICSRLIYRNVDFNENELDIFKELFELEDYGSSKGYTYKKIN